MVSQDGNTIIVDSHIRFDIVGIVLLAVFLCGIVLFLYSLKKGFTPKKIGLIIMFIMMPILMVSTFYPHLLQHERYEHYEKLANSPLYPSDVDIKPKDHEKLPLPGEHTPIDIYVRWSTKDLECTLKGKDTPVFFTGKWVMDLDCGDEKLNNPFKENIIDDDLVEEKFCHYGHCHYILKKW